MTARNGAAHPAGMVFPTGRDVLHLFLLARFALVAWFFPEQRWRTALDLTTPFQGDVARRRKAAAHASANDRIEKALGEPLADEARSRLADEIGYREAESLLAFLRELHPGGWSPSIETRGAENIDRALTQGEGAILWIAHQKHAFAWKKALHQAGIAATHLSRSVHGLSASEFGMRYFNPLWTRVECRYLAGRAVYPAGNPAPALRQLYRALKKNQVVSIQDWGTSEHRIPVPLLRGTRWLQPGAPTIAANTGAALLPVYCTRRGPGRFVVEIAPALDPGNAPSKQETIRHLAQQFAAGLAPFVAADPAQWEWESWSEKDHG